MKQSTERHSCFNNYQATDILPYFTHIPFLLVLILYFSASQLPFPNIHTVLRLPSDIGLSVSTMYKVY